MITVASIWVTTSEIAGAPGFEPGIAGPKPAALPLGYAPPQLAVSPNTQLARPHGQSPHGLQVGVASDASALGYAPPQLDASPNTQLARPHGQSPHGLQVGVASDASALGYAS